MVEKVFMLAQTLAGETQGEAAGLSLCCKAAVEELTGRLKPGVTAEECGDSFLWAAARLALADWWSLSGQPRKFTAGDVSVEESRGDADSLRRQALRALTGKLRDPGTAIQGVRG